MGEELGSGRSLAVYGRFRGWIDSLWIVDCWHRVKFKLRDYKFRTKWAYQRLRHGYSDVDWWNTNTYTSAFLYRCVRELRHNGTGVPGNFYPDEDIDFRFQEWRNVLFAMEYGFLAGMTLSDPQGLLSLEESRNLRAKLKIALNLYGEYFECLWD